MKKWIYIAAASIVLSVGSSCSTKVQSTSINHIALYVFDLQKSASFYKDVLQLQEINEPFHDGKHIWLRIGAHSQLHLIQGAASVQQHDINSHLAFSVPSLENFISLLETKQVKFGDWSGKTKNPTVRPDGIKQVYLQDPDNYWIEVNDDKF